MKFVKYHGDEHLPHLPKEAIAIVTGEGEELKVTKDGKEIKIKTSNLSVFTDSSEILVRRVNVPHEDVKIDGHEYFSNDDED